MAAGRGHPRLGVIRLHAGLALEAGDLADVRPGGDVEVRPQPGVLLQPVLVVGLQPVDLPVLEGEKGHGPEHLVIVLQGVHPVVLRQRVFQALLQGVVGAVPNAQDIDAPAAQAVAEVPIGVGELGGNKDKIHRVHLLC